MLEIALLRYMGNGLIEIIKVVHVMTVIYMAWHSAEAIIFGYHCHLVLAVILPECTHLPFHAHLSECSVHHGLVQNTEQCCTDTYIFFPTVILFHSYWIYLFYPKFSLHPKNGNALYCPPLPLSGSFSCSKAIV